MFDNMQMWIFGTAALVDTVLLFALLERQNWRSVTIWMLLLAFGVWSWHIGCFVRHWVDQSVGPLADPVRWLSMLLMAFGLMIMPSAALHGACRLLQHGELRLGSKPDVRLLLCYLPLLLVVPMGQVLATDPAKSMVNLLVNYRVPYVVWLCGVSVFTSYGLWRTACKTTERHQRRFFVALAASMLLIAGLVTIFVCTLDYSPSVTSLLLTIVVLIPMIPAILFAYFVMRFQLLPLILERTLVYGAVLMGAMLFHQLVLRRMISTVEDRYRLDLGVIEGTLAFLVILLYQPLRRRVKEALQSLLDTTESRRSDRQRLAVQLAARAGEPATESLNWFIATMQQSFGSKMGAAWICNQQGQIIAKAGSTELLDDDEVCPMLTAIARTNRSYLTHHTAIDPPIVEFVDRVRAGALLQFEHSEISGLFLIGCGRWGQPPTDQDLHALSLLVEQFGVTLHNSRLLELQLAAEHRFMQQEKLSTMGLISSSLAHEIKNPLSSINTIIQVLAEDLGSDSRYAEDLRMIRAEIERLTATTSELLSAARPPRADQSPMLLVELLAPTLRLLQFLANQREATLEVSFPAEQLIVHLDQVSLREVVFNLISNAVDAAGPKGHVHFVSRREAHSLIVEVRDTGPGMSTEQRNRLFEPFFTTKSTGTGLGLYIVARRVRELGGQIECRSEANQGTTFLLTLPCMPFCQHDPVGR